MPVMILSHSLLLCLLLIPFSIPNYVIRREARPKGVAKSARGDQLVTRGPPLRPTHFTQTVIVSQRLCGIWNTPIAYQPRIGHVQPRC
jgi:hypothetical protein